MMHTKDLTNCPHVEPASMNSQVIRPTMVEVYFPEKDKTLPYYNDRFDLKENDGVFVDGKMSGIRGRVMKVSHSFRIRLEDYDRIISRVNVKVQGKLYVYDSMLLTFDPETLCADQARNWFGIRTNDADFVTGDGTEDFELFDPCTTGVDRETDRKAYELCLENRVRFLSLDHGKGYAIVEDHGPKEVTFRMEDDNAGHGLTCSCREIGVCRHRQAVVLQLWDLMDPIEKKYMEEYRRTGYFAAVPKETLLPFILAYTVFGSITLE